MSRKIHIACLRLRAAYLDWAWLHYPAHWRLNRIHYKLLDVQAKIAREACLFDRRGLHRPPRRYDYMGPENFPLLFGKSVIGGRR